MRIWLLLGSLFSVLHVGGAPPHAFYLASIQGEISETTFTLTIKVFADDWQDALRASFPERGIKAGQADCETWKKEAEAYLRQHLRLLQGGKLIAWEWQSCERLSDVLRIQVEAELAHPWEQGEIQADFLMELFATQSNVIQVTRESDQQKCFLRLTRAQRRGPITFDR
jgi:hypothetical protein